MPEENANHTGEEQTANTISRGEQYANKLM